MGLDGAFGYGDCSSGVKIASHVAKTFKTQ
jgi:hypothetical protein